MATPSVAIVVPTSFQDALSADEEVSVRHLHHYLDAFDKYLVTPASRPLRLPGFDTVPFPDHYFGSALAHARLQLAEEFYARFSAYDYILSYHLDALVFSDQLLEWCRAGFDYVGAPWLPSQDSPWVVHSGVGNSGFALMNVASFLRVFHSDRRTVDPDEYWSRLREDLPAYARWLHLPKRYLIRLKIFNNVRREMRQWTDPRIGARNGDLFWASRATHYDPAFRIAPVDVALRFAFEAAPRACFEMNGRRLPFGCHAWARYDRGFWQPYLLP